MLPGVILVVALQATAFAQTKDVVEDMFWDLYWSVRAVEDFDSDPPVDLPRSSFGLAVGIGWSF